MIFLYLLDLAFIPQEDRKNYSQNGPKSKRPQVRRAPIWLKRPHKLVKTAPHPKNEGQNAPSQNGSIFFSFFFFL